MGYPGGKAGAGVYQKIINQIPPHDVYCEPFLGEGAVMLRKRPAARTIGVEVDAAVAARFTGWAQPHDSATAAVAAEFGGVGPSNIEVHNCCGINWLRHAFGLYRLASPADESSGPAGSPEAAAPAGDAGFGVGRSSGDGSRDATRWMIYCDPPYLITTRRQRRQIYRHEMTEGQHAELLSVITRLPAPGSAAASGGTGSRNVVAFVAISGYHSRMYDDALHGWRRIEFTAMTRGGRPAREVLWLNYDEPAELHDYRYLGGEKRERERVARKVRTWAAGLRRLPRLERQAILAELVISK
jgi:hypothetical protein